MRTTLVLSILLALLGLSSWWLLAESTPRADVAALQFAATGASDPVRTTIDPTNGLDDDDVLLRNGAAQLLDIAPGGRVEASLSGDDLLEVRVVDFFGGHPVPHAEIRWLDLGQNPGEAQRALLADPSQLEELLDARGRRTTANALGHARIPRVDGYAELTASTGDRWGRIRGWWTRDSESKAFEPTPKGLITLLPDGDLRAQVVDSNGIPMPGQAVELFQSQWRDMSESATARTDGAEGIATIHHAGWCMAIDPDSEWIVALVGPAGYLERVPVRAESLGGAPIQLVHHNAGYIEVLVLEPDGQPTRGIVLVTLEVDGVRCKERAADEGTAVYFDVALDLEVVCSARVARVEEALATVRVRGPRQVGEGVRIELHLPHSVPPTYAREHWFKRRSQSAPARSSSVDAR